MTKAGFQIFLNGPCGLWSFLVQSSRQQPVPYNLILNPLEYNVVVDLVTGDVRVKSRLKWISDLVRSSGHVLFVATMAVFIIGKILHGIHVRWN